MPLEKVELLLDNNPIQVNSYEINYDMFQGAGSFTADIQHDITIDLSVNKVQFTWKINGKPMMLGFLDKVTREYSKGELSQKIVGRDMMQVLIDNYIMQPQTYPGTPEKANSLTKLFQDTSGLPQMPIREIVNGVYFSSREIGSHAISKPTGSVPLGEPFATPLQLPVVNFPIWADNAKDAKGDPVAKYQVKSIKTGHGQSMFQFFSQLLNGLGMYLYNVPGTNAIIIHCIQSNSMISYDVNCKLSNEPPYPITSLLPTQAIESTSGYTVDKNSFIGKLKATSADNNVISASFTQDISEYYYFLRFTGQCSESDEFETTTAKSTLISEKTVPNNPDSYDGVMKFKNTTLNVLDETIWKKENVRLINNEFMTQNRKLYGFKYTVSGHCPKGSTIPYFFNHAALVNDTVNQLSNTNLLVCAVTYKGSKQAGQTTELELYSPNFVSRMISNATIPYPKKFEKFPGKVVYHA